MSSPARGSSSSARGGADHQLLELARLRPGSPRRPRPARPPRAGSPKSCQANRCFAPESRQVELDLAALEQHVHRHHDAAGAQHAVVDDAEVRDVREHDPDAVARLEPALLQQPGDPCGALVEHGVVGHRVVELEGGPVPMLGGGLGEQLGEALGHAPDPSAPGPRVPRIPTSPAPPAGTRQARTYHQYASACRAPAATIRAVAGRSAGPTSRMHTAYGLAAMKNTATSTRTPSRTSTAR